MMGVLQHGESGSNRSGRRRLIWGLLCLVLILLVPTSAGVSATTAEHRGTQTITVATLPIEPGALVFYAKHKGFFQKQGLDVKIMVLPDAAQIIAAVLSDEAQFSGLSTGGLAVLKSRGAPVKLVAGAALHRAKAPTSALVAAPGKRITRARDLVGKVVALDGPNTPAHIGLLKWLKLSGVSADRIRIKHIPFHQVLGPLTRGLVDAAVVPEPFVTLTTQRGAKRVAPVLNAVCPQECLLSAYMARRDVSGELAARFRNAIQAAAVWANQKKNHAVSGAIVAKYAPIDKAVIRKMARSTYATRLRPAQAQPWIDVYAEFKVIPKSFSAQDLVK